MEDESIQIIKEKLPPHWVIRPYRPDYGIDLSVEVFKLANDNSNQSEALGEHFFVQVKSVEKMQLHKIKVHPCMNVAKFSREINFEHSKHDPIEIDVLKYSLDTALLSTIQAMGASVVVLLFFVALDVKQVFFLCLNDYIDKILIPDDPLFCNKKSKTIFIPVKNEVINKEKLLVPIRFYAKRAKFYSAFNLFNYQNGALQYCVNPENARSMAIHFIDNLKYLDIWQDVEMWRIMDYYLNKMLKIEKSLLSMSFTVEGRC